MSENPTLPVDQNFWDDVDEAADARDERRPRLQFGQLTITPGEYTHWVDRQPIPVTPEVYATLPAGEKSLKLLFTVNVQEINPDLDFTYERKVGPSDKDWHKILKPSINALLGKTAMSKGNYSNTLQSLNGKYVKVDDFPQTKDDEYNTIKLLEIYETKEACFAAHKLAFTPSQDSGEVTPPTLATPTLSVPEGWEASAWQSMLGDIRKALVGGLTPETIANDYGVPVANIEEIQKQMTG